MENPDYAQAKRYCEVMNTMWVTFFYGGAIPVGVIFSFLMLNAYYWIDKYIVLRRRTIKDSISRDLSIEMIETLEMILVLYGIGSLTMNYKLTGAVLWQDVFMIVFGVLYSILPIQDITEKVFPVEVGDG